MVRGFASDNYAGISPEAFRALEYSNQGHVVAYGEDQWTQKLKELVQEVFETSCSVFIVFNGTSANSLALAHLCPPYETILCHEQSHLKVDECGAPQFFSGGAGLTLVSGGNGKMNLDLLRERISERTDIHAQSPRVISLAQVTECGTVYTLEELRRIQEICRNHDLRFHMDGARFANALVSLKITPAEMSWKVGVDVLSFGFTKNGVPMGDLVVFFNPLLAKGFEFRVKQGGQLASKSRFLAAPIFTLLQTGEWIRNATQANAMAALLEKKIRNLKGIDFRYPRQANSLFLDLSSEVVERLHQKGWPFYHFGSSGYRLMTAWDHTEEDIDLFMKDLVAVIGAD